MLRTGTYSRESHGPYYGNKSNRTLSHNALPLNGLSLSCQELMIGKSPIGTPTATDRDAHAELYALVQEPAFLLNLSPGPHRILNAQYICVSKLTLCCAGTHIAVNHEAKAALYAGPHWILTVLSVYEKSLCSAQAPIWRSTTRPTPRCTAARWRPRTSWRALHSRRSPSCRCTTSSTRSRASKPSCRCWTSRCCLLVSFRKCLALEVLLDLYSRGCASPRKPSWHPGFTNGIQVPSCQQARRALREATTSRNVVKAQNSLRGSYGLRIMEFGTHDILRSEMGILHAK